VFIVSKSSSLCRILSITLSCIALLAYVKNKET
jgi:hypothetical protein